MQNYFNYFTEIEEHFQRRRGSLLLLSTLDWALIETWREAGIPLEIALRGIDEAFDKHDARQRGNPGRRLRQVNGLAWCAPAVMEAAEQQKEAAIGLAVETAPQPDAGFEAQRIAAHLDSAAGKIDAAASAPDLTGQTIGQTGLAGLAQRVRTLADSVRMGNAAASDIEALERQITVLEEKLFALLTTQAEEDVLLRFKTEAARDLAGYRSRLSATQLRQIEQQFLHKRLLEHFKLPRLSLFYMSQA